MLYHYTDCVTAREIIAAGQINANPVIVYRDLLGREKIELARAVWLTTAEVPPPTVLAKLIVAGWSVDQVWRFVVDVEALDLPDWAGQHDYDPGLFRWMMLTATMAGENWENWRLTNDAIAKWASVESFQGNIWKKEMT